MLGIQVHKHPKPKKKAEKKLKRIHPKKERTFVILKPDAIQRSLVGEIIGRFERVGLKIIALRMVMIDGKKIEPFIAPLGFDWKIGISLVTSFAAREVFVGTMSTIYSVGDAENTKSIREKMLAEVNPKTGEKIFTPAVGFSLMLFYAFAMQCMSTIAVVYRETKHWKWPLYSLFIWVL